MPEPSSCCAFPLLLELWHSCVAVQVCSEPQPGLAHTSSPAQVDEMQKLRADLPRSVEVAEGQLGGYGDEQGQCHGKGGHHSPKHL